MSSSFDAIAIDAITACIRASHGTADAPVVGPFGVAMCLALLPSGRAHTLLESRSMLKFFEGRGVAGAVPCSPELPIIVRNTICAVAEGCQRHENATNFKISLGLTLLELLSYRQVKCSTVPVKPSLSASTSTSAAAGPAIRRLSDDLWGHIASFLPTADLLTLPAVGSRFFAERDDLTWGTLYYRCLGTFSPTELDIDQERWTVAYYNQVMEETRREEPSYWRDFKIQIRPLLASSRLTSQTPSAGAFFDKIAPRGVVTLGTVRLNVVNTSPMHLRDFRSGCSVRMEEVSTCRGVVRIVSLMVPVGVVATGAGIFHSQTVLPVSGCRAIASSIANALLEKAASGDTATDVSGNVTLSSADSTSAIE